VYADVIGIVIGAAYVVVAGAATIENDGIGAEVVATGIRGGTAGNNGSSTGSTAGAAAGNGAGFDFVVLFLGFFPPIAAAAPPPPPNKQQHSKAARRAHNQRGK